MKSMSLEELAEELYVLSSNREITSLEITKALKIKFGDPTYYPEQEISDVIRKWRACGSGLEKTCKKILELLWQS